jgi:hypothetical protein
MVEKLLETAQHWIVINFHLLLNYKDLVVLLATHQIQLEGTENVKLPKQVSTILLDIFSFETLIHILDNA